MAQITQETLNSIMELYHSGKLEEAEAKVKELLSESPNEIAILNILGIIQDAKKEYEEAIKTYKKALDLNTDVPETHFNLGSLLHRQGKNEEAITSYKKAIDLKSDFVNAYFNLGLVSQNIGDYEKAIENYKKAIELQPDFHESIGALGTI